MHQVSLFSPAKINLTLHVTGRRADGYHELDSIFVPLAFGDDLVLRIEPARRAAVRCRCPGHPELASADNLAYRAAARYLERAGWSATVEIEITKRIWIAAGLGGGSSNAGTALRALQDWPGPDRPAPLGEATLAALALELGADVPFFLRPRPARVRGIGERIAPVELPELHLVLVNPGSALSTTEVFRRFDEEKGDVVLLSKFGKENYVPLFPHVPRNDLQGAAVALCPEIARMIALLQGAGAEATSLSGSGPTCFGLFRSGAQAAAAGSKLSENKTLRLVVTRSARA